ncbi:MAG: hypothetical protein R3Y27_01230 [Clostridia bacterium]
MKKIRVKNNPLNYTIDAKNLLIFFPLLVIIGKVVRWTIMVETLINMSKGWGYASEIINGDWDFAFLGISDVLNGSPGEDTNMYLMFKIFRAMCLNIPDDFYSFEIAITLVWGLMLFLLFKKITKKILVSEFMFVSIAVIVLNVYCFSLSKETFQMLYFYLLFFVMYSNTIPDKNKFKMAVAVIIFSTFTFRTYYFLIIVFAFAALKLTAYAIRKKPNKSNFNVLVVYLGLVGLYAAIMLALNLLMPTLYTRMADSLLLASEATSSADTYIENVFATSSSDLVAVILEYAIVVLRLLFPVELIGLGVKYFPYIIYQFCMSLFMIRALKSYATNTKTQNVALLIMLGFVFTSATFEVDYGAWIRHGAVTLPTLLLMIGMIKPKKIPEDLNKKEVCK